MMTKNEFLEVLIPELKRIEEVEHLRDLARNGWYDEAQAVLDGVDYSSLAQYYKAAIGKKEQLLTVADIPQEYLVTFTLYLYGSQHYNEADVMRNWKELSIAVAKQGKEGAIIAKKMNDCYLTWFETIDELMEPYEEDEEDAVD